MEKRRITKTQLTDWLAKIAAGFETFGPLKSEEYHLFGPLKGAAELDFPNTRNAPKNALFRHTETLARFTRTPRGMEYLSDGDEVKASVVFVRPCDAASFCFLDKVFGWKPYDDPYYQARREKTVVVSIGCVKAPYSSCFCASVGGEPLGDRGADVLLTDLGGDWLAEFLTPKGETLLATLGGAAAATDADAAKKEELREAAKATVTAKIPAKEIAPTLKRVFESPFWATIHRRCLACGTCTYLCPSCHCFDIADETEGDKGTRIRSWDSCMFPLFTKETSGHNPRPSQRERWRQRVMHKFSYIPENFDELGCVGCGRCVINCPVNIDIRKIVEDIAKL